MIKRFLHLAIVLGITTVIYAGGSVANRKYYIDQSYLGKYNSVIEKGKELKAVRVNVSTSTAVCIHEVSYISFDLEIRNFSNSAINVGATASTTIWGGLIHLQFQQIQLGLLMVNL